MSVSLCQTQHTAAIADGVVDVVFARPLRQAYSYRVPREWTEVPLPVGVRVRAPLGGRDELGVVVASPAANPAGKRSLKSLRTLVEPERPVPKELLTLARWISEYYMCSLGEALSPILTGSAAASDRTVRAIPIDWESEQSRRLRITPHERRVLSQLSSRRSVRCARLQQKGLTRRSLSATLQSLHAKGLVELTWKTQCPPIPADAVVRGLNPDRLPGLSDEIQQALHRIVDTGATGSWTRHAMGFPGGRSQLRTLLSDDILDWDPVPPGEFPGEGSASVREPGPSRFDDAQRVAYHECERLIDEKKFATALLWGATGSGKTAVYCAAIRHVWEHNRTALFLVPEITLAAPMIRRLEATLGEPVGVWHSGLTRSQRYWMSRRVAEGRYRLVVGARSAVFAPLPNLGLVIVDEEHAESYKQSDPAPRYHARDVAVLRAKLNKALCLLGSATPSCESYSNAQSGKYTLLRLRRRAPGRSMPLVRLVDLTKRKLTEAGGWVTDELREALVNTTRAGQKAIVFLNRRGYATMVACSSCGHFEVCSDCGLTLTYHARDRTFRCHICASRVSAAQCCPRCKGTEFLFRGVGTQKIEEILTNLDEGISLARLDADVAARRGAAEEIISGFAGDTYNLLVGTQMVAKGLDVAEVGLVGVIWADQQMAFPDFRAEERTFQLLTQVAGRAGRGTKRGNIGEVLIQTFRPDHDLIELAAAQDATLFFERELPRRQALLYPPLTHLMLVAFSSPDAEMALRAGERFAHHCAGLSQAILRSVRILGPAPAVIARRAGQSTYHCLIKSRALNMIRPVVADFRDREEAAMRRNQIAMTIDVDPINFW